MELELFSLHGALGPKPRTAATLAKEFTNEEPGPMFSEFHVRFAVCNSKSSHPLAF